MTDQELSSTEIPSMKKRKPRLATIIIVLVAAVTLGAVASIVWHTKGDSPVVHPKQVDNFKTHCGLPLGPHGGILPGKCPGKRVTTTTTTVPLPAPVDQLNAAIAATTAGHVETTPGYLGNFANPEGSAGAIATDVAPGSSVPLFEQTLLQVAVCGLDTNTAQLVRQPDSTLSTTVISIANPVCQLTGGNQSSFPVTDNYTVTINNGKVTKLSAHFTSFQWTNTGPTPIPDLTITATLTPN